jgi:hypothetical protein
MMRVGHVAAAVLSGCVPVARIDVDRLIRPTLTPMKTEFYSR